MRSPPAVFLAALLLLAGCSEDSGPLDPSTATPSSTGVVTDAAADKQGFNGQPWEVGRWWKWRLESVAHDPVEVTSVVTAVTAQSYRVGISSADEVHWPLAYHTIALGPVARPNLAWMAHGMPVEILDLPLADGKTWKRDFWFGTDITMTATAEGQDHLFQIQGKDPSGGTTWAGQWDAEANTFRELSQHFGGPAPFSTATLIDTGAAFAGEAFDVVFGDLYRSNGPVAPPDAAASFTVPTGVTRMFAACWLGGAAGHYEVAFVPPSGTSARCQQDHLPAAGGTRLHILTWSPSVESGSWRVERIAGGEGSVTLEVIRVDLVPAGTAA